MGIVTLRTAVRRDRVGLDVGAEYPPPQRIHWTADVFARLFVTHITCPPG